MAFEKSKPRGLFSEFYGIFFNGYPGILPAPGIPSLSRTFLRKWSSYFRLASFHGLPTIWEPETDYVFLYKCSLRFNMGDLTLKT